MSKLLKSKILLGVAILAVVAFAGVALAADGAITMTLKQGMNNVQVKYLQQTLNEKGYTVATSGNGSLGYETSYFGPATAAAVKSFQAATGLTADGIVGALTRAALNVATTTTTTTGTTTTTTTTSSGSSSLSGDAGDLTVTGSSKNTEDEIKEGKEEKVLSLKLEADDSDIEVTNLKLEFKNATAYGTEKLTDYADEVKVYLGSEEVASVDVSDFSRDSGSPDLYTKSISLDGAVVEDGETEYMYVAVVASDDIDSSDVETGLVWTLTGESVRFTDATGAIMSDSVDEVVKFDFTLASEDDDLAIKSSSANPDDATVKIYENKKSDEVLALAFKLDNDEDSSDMELQTIQVTADTSIATTSMNTVAAAENLIDSVTLKLGGEEFDAEDLDVDTDFGNDGSGHGVVTYTFDIDGDVVIDAGDVEEAKVYVTFYEQGSSDANYADDTTVVFAVANADVEAEVDGDEVDSSDITGSQTGATLTLSPTASTVSSMDWKVNTTGTIIDFFFTIEAEDEDFTVTSASILDSTTGTAAFVNNTAAAGSPVTTSEGVLTKYSGDDVDNVDATGLQVDEGEKTTFRVRYTLDEDTNNKWAEVKITSVAGQAVEDDLQTSDTATTSGF